MFSPSSHSSPCSASALADSSAPTHPGPGLWVLRQRLRGAWQAFWQPPALGAHPLRRGSAAGHTPGEGRRAVPGTVSVTVSVSLPATVPCAGPHAALQAGPDSTPGAPPPEEHSLPPGCAFFDSSQDLREGLSVRETPPASEWPLGLWLHTQLAGWQPASRPLADAPAGQRPAVWGADLGAALAGARAPAATLH